VALYEAERSAKAKGNPLSWRKKNRQTAGFLGDTWGHGFGFGNSACGAPNYYVIVADLK
jgi:hypothetical protein